MRRPGRDLVLSLLACGAAFAHGWQQERGQRVAAVSAQRADLPGLAPPLAPRATATARHASVATATPTYDDAALSALLDRLYDLDPAEWTDADVAAAHALLAAGAPMVAELLVDRCHTAGDCAALGPALEARGAAGDAQAASLLARLYTDPDFPGADPVRAFDWMVRYAELGDAEAKLDAAFRTLADAPEDRPEWRARALAWLSSAASGGSARAALELVKLLDGEGMRFGVEPDPVAAARWYDALRRNGDPQVLRQAALHYQARGDAASTTRAVVLWTQQGELGGAFGSNNAAWLLAVCGRGLDDYERAWRLIQREHRDHGESWQSVDTLAGVQAQLGMWGDALASQQRALGLFEASDGDGMPWLEDELRARLAGYAELRGPTEPDLCPQPP